MNDDPTLSDDPIIDSVDSTSSDDESSHSNAIASPNNSVTVFLPIKNTAPENIPEDAIIMIHSGTEDVLQTIKDMQEADPELSDEALTRAAQCCAFWKSTGIEALIYTCSYGGITLVSGVLIRFLNFDALTTILASGTAGVFVNDNARIFFSHLLRTPGEKVPDDKKAQYAYLKQYALLPLSLLAAGVISGSVLSIIGDPNIGTRQSVSAAATQLTGPFMSLIGASIRYCYQGSIVIDPNKPGVAEAFKSAYGTQPNKDDNNRPAVYGLLRNTLVRMLAFDAMVLSTWYLNGYNVETYCGYEGEQYLKNVTDHGGTITGDDLRNHCTGGNATFLFRELGVGVAYSFGLMVLEPAVNYVLDKVFDYFYRPPEPDADGVQIEEVND